MKNFLTTVALLSVTWPVLASTEIQDGDVRPTRPGDESGEIVLSDGLAECAAILAVESTKSNNLVQRNGMMNGSATWFAASGDLALEEGNLPETDLWEKKVSNWAERIGSVDAMAQFEDWMAYCADIGQQRGLDPVYFVAR
jgi:hypothetical protein